MELPEHPKASQLDAAAHLANFCGVTVLAGQVLRGECPATRSLPLTCCHRGLVDCTGLQI